MRFKPVGAFVHKIHALLAGALCLTLFSASLAGCARLTTPVPTSAPAPTATAFLPSTATPAPTATLAPTATPEPTATPPIVTNAASIPIIEYHYPSFVLSSSVQMQPDWFAEQLDWLAAEGYTTLSATDLVDYVDGKRTFPEKSVVLSFDLGTARYSDYAEGVIPLLRKHNFHAVFFLLVNVGMVGDDCTHPQNLFCWEDFKTWADEGLISFGSHGVYHPDYAKETDENIRWDMSTSKITLEQKLGVPMLLFAYPFDSAPQNAQRIASSVGYKLAVSGNNRTDLGVKVQDANRFVLPRMYPYANPVTYPKLYAYDQTFADVISKTVHTEVAAVQPTAVMDAEAVAAAYTKACQSANALSGTERDLAIKKIQFTPDYAGALISASCNYWPKNDPKAVVLHFTRGTLAASQSEFRQPQNTSSHYIIDRDGTIYQVLPESLGAHHVAYIGGNVESCPEEICASNRPELYTIGIELVNQGQVPEDWAGEVYEDYAMSFGWRWWEEYPQAQMDALRKLVLDISARYDIPVDIDHILGHNRIQQKADPGPALNLFWPRVGTPQRAPIFTTEN